jgi:hypothetical protein
MVRMVPFRQMKCVSTVSPPKNRHVRISGRIVGHAAHTAATTTINHSNVLRENWGRGMGLVVVVPERGEVQCRTKDDNGQSHKDRTPAVTRQPFQCPEIDCCQGNGPGNHRQAELKPSAHGAIIWGKNHIGIGIDHPDRLWFHDANKGFRSRWCGCCGTGSRLSVDYGSSPLSFDAGRHRQRYGHIRDRIWAFDGRTRTPLRCHRPMVSVLDGNGRRPHRR